jgi:flagella basal body P-ring formation protein FlgA
MKLRDTIAVGLLACAAPAWPVCREVEGDRITARDVAVSLPPFLRISPDVQIAYAPVPGARRVLRAPELLAAAKRHGIQLEGAVADLCFEWRMRPLEPERMLEAMRASLDMPGAEIEIAEMARFPAPPGNLEFPRDRLGSPAMPDSRTPVLWRGEVAYGDRRRFAVWARVLIRVKTTRVLAAESLKTGQPAEARQFRVEEFLGFPLPSNIARSPEQVVGRLPLRPVTVGSEIRLDQFSAPFDVSRGDTVEVEVQSGSTRLSFSGRAESAGRSGETISVRNPESNRVFQARVKGKGSVVVIAGAAQINRP